MKKYNLVLIFTFILLLIIIGCQGTQASDTSFYFKDIEGSILASKDDLVKGAALISYDPERAMKVIQVDFKNTDKLEEITSSNLHSPIYIYYANELIFSPLVNVLLEDGRVEIHGYFSMEKAKEIVEAINLQ